MHILLIEDMAKPHSAFQFDLNDHIALLFEASNFKEVGWSLKKILKN